MRQMVWMLIGLEAIFAFSYLGYIELPNVSTTTLHVLVIVAAMALGWRGSVPVACVFAATSMWDIQSRNMGLTQEFIAFMGLFGIVGIIIQWIYEYYTVLRIKMNQKLLEQSVKISIDPLTGVFSRFAYHEAMERSPSPLPAD